MTEEIWDGARVVDTYECGKKLAAEDVKGNWVPRHLTASSACEIGRAQAGMGDEFWRGYRERLIELGFSPD